MVGAFGDVRWVKNEATAAADRGVPLPAQIDSARLPLAFRSRQTADLCDWHTATARTPAGRSLCHGIAALLKQPQPIQHTAPAAASRQRLHALLAVLAVTLLAAVLSVTVLVSLVGAHRNPRLHRRQNLYR